MAVVAEFSDRLAQVADMKAFADLLGAAARDLGFRYHALVEHADLARPPPGHLLVQNYPHPWVERFASAALHRRDPVQKAAITARGSFAWHELPTLLRLAPDQEGILEDARRAGLGQGYTIPLRAPGEPLASCSFVTQANTPLPSASLLAAQLLAHVAFAAVPHFLPTDNHRERRLLSPRQRECAALMSQGKTDWEIGRILGLSEETVTKYLNAARARYGVARRVQLAVHALFDGQIDFTEAIQRHGPRPRTRSG